MNFNWRTEDEQGWKRETATETAVAPKSRSRQWRHRFLLFLTLLIGLFILQRALQRQVDSNRRAMERDIHASIAVVNQAIQAGDEELLTTVLSGREPAWTAMQKTLLQDGLLSAGAARPFGFNVMDATSSLVEIEWSADLQTAFVTSQSSVTVAPGQRHAGAPVALQQTTIYRRGADRWLLAPPDNWGPWHLERGRLVQISFRQRDELVALQMLPVFDEAVATLCKHLDKSCPPSNPFHVRLDPAGASLQKLQNDRLPTFRFGELSLPSPSLVGRSPDAVGSETLTRGYAHYLLVATSQELLDFDCCQGAQFMDALAASVANELGYGPGPLQEADFLPMVDALQGLGQFNRLWWGAYRSPFTEADRAQVAAFNSFLSAQSAVSYVQLQQALADAYGFWDWVQPFAQLDVVADRDELEAAWRGFVLARANESQHALSSTPSPDQILSLICEDAAGQRALHNYDPLTDRWTVAGKLRGRAPALASTPGDDGLLIFDRVTADPTWLPATLLLDGQEIPLAGELVPAYSLPSDPQGRYMPMWRTSQSGRTVDGPVLLDVPSCLQEGGCRQRFLSGLPSWSPSGEGLLIWHPDTGRIHLKSRDLRSSLDFNISSSQPPFWLDERSAIIISEDGSAVQSAALNSGAPLEKQTLLHLNQVLVALDRAGDGRRWRFAQAYRVPWAQALVGAVTLPESGARHYYLARFDGWRIPVDILPLTYVPQLTAAAPEALISGNGNWLSLHLYPEALEDARFVLHDLRTGAIVLDKTSPYFTATRAHDWSADGQWLARIGPHSVELTTANGRDSAPLLRQFVSSGQLQCSSVAWINRQ